MMFDQQSKAFGVWQFQFKFGGGIGAAPINYTLPNIDILPAGNYTLLLIGINWGGPANFSLTVNHTTGPATVLSTAKRARVLVCLGRPAGVAFTIA